MDKEVLFILLATFLALIFGYESDTWITYKSKIDQRRRERLGIRSKRDVTNYGNNYYFHKIFTSLKTRLFKNSQISNN